MLPVFSNVLQNVVRETNQTYRWFTPPRFSLNMPWSYTKQSVPLWSHWCHFHITSCRIRSNYSYFRRTRCNIQPYWKLVYYFCMHIFYYDLNVCFNLRFFKIRIWCWLYFSFQFGYIACMLLFYLYLW